MEHLINEMALSHGDGEDQRPLIDKVKDMLEPGASRSRGATGRRSHSPAPLVVHVLDLLMVVETEARRWHHTLLRFIDDPFGEEAPLLDTKDHLLALPAYVRKFGSKVIEESVAREVRYWHSRCLSFLGVSPIEQRYLLTEDAAKALDKSPVAFKSWAKRRGLSPVGYLPIPHDGGATRQGVWDMSELHRYGACAVQ